MSDAVFNRDGTLSRKLKTACEQCGAVESCDTCWEHTRDWSPFCVWTCALCAMPVALFDDDGHAPVRCDYCGFDEAIDCTTTGYRRENGKMVAYEIKYDPITRKELPR